MSGDDPFCHVSSNQKLRDDYECLYETTRFSRLHYGRLLPVRTTLGAGCSTSRHHRPGFGSFLFFKIVFQDFQWCKRSLRTYILNIVMPVLVGNGERHKGRNDEDAWPPHDTCVPLCSRSKSFVAAQPVNLRPLSRGKFHDQPDGDCLPVLSNFFNGRRQAKARHDQNKPARTGGWCQPCHGVLMYPFSTKDLRPPWLFPCCCWGALPHPSIFRAPVRLLAVVSHVRCCNAAQLARIKSAVF